MYTNLTPPNPDQCVHTDHTKHNIHTGSKDNVNTMDADANIDIKAKDTDKNIDFVKIMANDFHRNEHNNPYGRDLITLAANFGSDDQCYAKAMRTKKNIHKMQCESYENHPQNA